MSTIIALAIDSAGVGVGVFVGMLIGLSVRRKRVGTDEGLIGNSVLVTALVLGLGAMALMMLMKALWG
ncbi:hypothetical protein [Actibacterium pelagium]|uniref:Uncharacterized protein n=1 Tax=Actibacterium pelagium TaxID=2029103 RepID=A0A917EIQ6_9RHOB|nr:hypothetical protein [Actibacterium pelagium]GGE41293.1 hypothetical protein GCM10011517_06120 [Actibacterium pelagium]